MGNASLHFWTSLYGQPQREELKISLLKRSEEGFRNVVRNEWIAQDLKNPISGILKRDLMEIMMRVETADTLTLKFLASLYFTIL